MARASDMCIASLSFLALCNTHTHVYMCPRMLMGAECSTEPSSNATKPKESSSPDYHQGARG